MYEQILNSDLGFTLQYGNNVPIEVLQATVNALQPYPQGAAPSGLLRPFLIMVAHRFVDERRHGGRQCCVRLEHE